MIKLFFVKILGYLKTLGYRVNERRRVFSLLFPSLGVLCLVVLWFYLSWKISFLMPQSNELNSISCSISNAIVYYRTVIIEFVFNNIGLIAAMAMGMLCGLILSFLEKRKAKKRLPIIGIPHKDNVTVLLMLFNLRCLEIGMLYYIIQDYQKEADQQGDKGNWLELFLIEYLGCSNSDYCPYSSESDEKRKWRLQNNKETVSNLLKEKFDLDKWNLWPSDYHDSSFKDLLVILKRWNQLNYVKSITALQGINVYGELSNTISALLNSYNKFNSRDSIIFVYDKPLIRVLKSKIVKSHDTIEEIWKEIIFVLKSSLVFLKIQNDTSFDIEKILKEIDALEALQDSNAIRSTMERMRFSEEKKGLSWFSEEDANLILNKLKQNHLNDLY